MSYTATKWVDGETPVNAANLNKLENGVSALHKAIPEALPNPYPLTINGKQYDGSEAVDITVTGGTTNENTPLGQTPVTLTQSANIKLVGEGEYSYTIKGKTIADLSTAGTAKTKAEIVEHENYIELSTDSNGNWYDSYVTLSFSGLTVGEKYLFIVSGLGLDTSNLITNGYYQIRNANNTQLGVINQDSASVLSAEFTADTSDITVRCYPANNYYWGSGYRTARVSDIYINKASDGTDRTGVINESGTFTDSYSFGQLPKGITITSEPSCEVYSVSGGGGSGEVSAPLEGKTVVCFGDSLFGMYAGDNSAPAFVAQKTGATVHNVGFSGCRMSEHPYTGYNEFCMYALANAIASGDWSLQDAAASSGSSNFPDQLAILKSIDFNAVDYIVIHYGTNDFAAGEGVAIDNPANAKATNTLCGALRHSIEKLLGAFPKLKIFVSLPAFRYWTATDGTVTYSDEKKNVKGNTLPEFVKALAETAKEYNLPVIDCYYGLGINKNNASTFLADGTHHNIDGRKRFGEYIGAKLISEGDTFHGADSETGGSGGSGGSASIDVTASVGQTIVVEEVDANGKPTKWKAAEYQPRTHWTDETVILPEITVEIDPEAGMGVIPIEGTFEWGKEYIITYNGAEYVCPATILSEDLDGDGEADFDNVIMGNAGAVDEHFPTTNDPFVLMYNLLDATDENNFIYGWVIAPLDGSASVTLSIAEVKYTPIPVQYVGNALPYYIEVTGDGSAENPYVCHDTVGNVEAIYRSGRQLIVKLASGLGGYGFYNLILYVQNEHGTIFGFGMVNYVTTAGGYIETDRLFLKAQDDNTFVVDTKIG